MAKEFTKQNPKGLVNFVSVQIETELGCNPAKGEYGLYITGIIGSLDISPFITSGDISLIQEAIYNDVDFDKLPEEGVTEVVLEEGGEWEDVFWNKDYLVKSICQIHF